MALLAACLGAVVTFLTLPPRNGAASAAGKQPGKSVVPTARQSQSRARPVQALTKAPTRPCPIPKRYRVHFVHSSQLQRVPLPLLAAVAYTESRFKPRARSQVGAIGLFQLMPETAASMGVDPHVPRLNIAAGAKYLRDLLVRFHGSKRLALAAYNAGPGAVSSYGGIPPYPETQYYVREVITKMSHYDGQLGSCRR